MFRDLVLRLNIIAAANSEQVPVFRSSGWLSVTSYSAPGDMTNDLASATPPCFYGAL